MGLGLFIMAARSVTDPDVWWHLRTGQLMLQNHQIFHVDPYSFTRSGQPWIDHEWLSQILIFSLYRVTGWGGLIGGFALAMAAAYLLVFVRTASDPYVAGIFTVWGALASVPCWGVRPQMLTLLLASILLFLLERSYQHPDLLWFVPPLLLLWVNLHAGYAVGLAFLFLFFLGDAVDSHLRPPERTVRLKKLALIFILCAAVVTLNPYGLQLYRYPLDTLRSRSMLAYIGEWHSPDFHESRYAPFLLMLLAALVLPALSPRRLRTTELLLVLATMFAALRSVRHIPLFVLVAVPALSSLVQARLDHSPARELFGASNPPTRTKMVINCVLLLAFVAFTSIRFGYVVRHQATSEAHEFPAAAASYLDQNQVPGPILNHYNWGGYFIWKLYPRYRVFIDGRADVYRDAFMDAFAATYHLRGASWRQPLQEWGIRTVVLPPDAPLITALRSSPGWKSVYADTQVVILSREP